MQLTPKNLAAIEATMPGHFVLYRLTSGKLKTLYFSKGIPAFSGLTKKEYEAIIQEDAIEVVLDVDRPFVEASIKELLFSRKKENSISYRLTHATKGFIWVHAQAKIIGEKGKDPIILVNFTNASLETEEHNFLLNGTAYNIYVIEKDSFQLLYANAAALATWKKEKLAILPCYTFINGLKSPCPWCSVALMKNGTYQTDASYSEASHKWFSIRCQEMSWYGRKAVAIFAKDVTESKEHELSLELDNKTLDSTLTNLPGGIGVFRLKDGKAIALATNAQLKEILGTDLTTLDASAYRNMGEIPLEDKMALAKVMSVCMKEKALFTIEYRQKKPGQDSYHWYRLRIQTRIANGEVTAFLFVNEITDEKTKEEDLRVSHALYDKAVAGADLGVWTYHFDDDSYVMGKSNSFIAQQVGEDIASTGVSHPLSSLLSILTSKSSDDLRHAYQEIGRGVPSLSVDVWYDPKKTMQGFHCEHISLTGIKDATGKVVSATGFAQDVTSERMNEQRFNTLYRQFMVIHPDTLGNYRLNLSKNQVLDIFGTTPLTHSESIPKTADELFLAIKKNISDPKLSALFPAKSYRQKLMTDFQKGDTAVTYDFPTISHQNRRVWISVSIILAKNPSTNDVEALLGFSDITGRQIDDNVLSCLSQANYDVILVLDPLSRTYTLKSLSKIKEKSLDASPEKPYDANYENVLNHWVYPVDRALFRQHTQLDFLCKRMAEKNSDTFVFRSLSPDGKILYKKATIVWLDDSKTLLLGTQSDVTDIYEKQWEREKKEARTDSLEAAIRGIPAGLLVLRKEKGSSTIHVVMTNQALGKIASNTEDNIRESDFEELLKERTHPDDLKLVQDSLKELFSKKNHTEYTYRTRGNTNSDYFWLSAIGQATEEKDGSKTAYLLFNDATQAKRREAEFEQKIKDYTSFFPSAVTSFTLNLTQDNLTDLSSTMPIITQLIHGKNAGCIAAALENVISDEETKKNVPPQLQSQALLEAFRKGNSYLSFDYPLTLDNGDILWHQIIINMVENPTTGDVEAFGYSLDITEQKKDEQMIRYITEQKLDYVAIVDFRRSSLTIRNLNREMTKLGFFSNFAYSYAQFIRLISLGLPTPDDKKQFLALTDLATIHDSLKKSGKYSYSFPYLEEGNSTRKLVQVGWLDHKQDLAVYLRTDITEAYNREQDYLVKLKNALAVAEEANHAKSDFVSRISHDIRTPINIIKNMSDFALQDIDNREKLKDDLSKISSANMFLLSLINDVLDISKIDSGRIELHPEPYPYEEHERNIRNIGEPMAKAKGLTFIVQKRVHENDGCAVCDITRINQILLNLLSNAIKYTPEGGTVTYTSDSELLPNAQMRMGMIVSDTGIGMSEAFQKRLFQPFTQELDNPYRPKGMTGTGLGLSIVKRLVGLMNGTIEVRSQLGKGTTIQVNLIVPDATRDPKYKESLTDKAATEKAPPLKTSALQGKILLAEDNEINAEITERILGSFGLSADWAKNGKEAVDLFNQAPVHTYQAVLMDIQMPIMDGYEATRQIRALAKEDSKTVPIIAMTADAFNDAIEKGQQAGMNAHLTKPIDAEKTKQVLTDYLNK